MKRLLCSALAATCLSFVLPVPVAFAADEPESEMTESMEKMSGAFRRVRRMVGNPDNSAQVLELLATIRTEASASSKLIPMRAEEVPEAQRAKFVEDFQKRMAEFIAAVEKTEAAVKARDFAAATAMVNDLAAMQKAGHKDFKKDDKKG
jgi:cytochrome c556